jgi:hypothetical protein
MRIIVEFVGEAAPSRVEQSAHRQVYNIGLLGAQLPQQARNVPEAPASLCITVTVRFRRLSTSISAEVKSPTPHTRGGSDPAIITIYFHNDSRRLVRPHNTSP